jgi:hypothetical protein
VKARPIRSAGRSEPGRAIPCHRGMPSKWHAAQVRLKLRAKAPIFFVGIFFTEARAHHAIIATLA